MTDFYSEKIVKVRKPRHCDGCGALLNKGDQALTYSGRFQGDFGSFSHHIECRQAEIALNNLADRNSDEWYALREIEADEWDWLLEDWPVVAARMNVTAERIREHKEERARMLEWSMELARKREAARRSI